MTTRKTDDCARETNLSYCPKCKQWKPKSDFHKDKTRVGGVAGHCKSCKKELRIANSEQLTQKAIERQRNNPKQAIQYVRQWEKNNPDKLRTYKQASNKRQDERIKNNPELLARRRETKRKWAQKYRDTFPEANRARQHKRRAQISNSEGTYTQEEWFALCEKYENRCLCCKETKPLTVDHIKALSLGGSNTIENIQPLCFSCNSAKGTKEIDYR